MTFPTSDPTSAATGAASGAAPSTPQASGASISIDRPLEWMDTDAAGIWHYSTVIRFAEHAELELHTRLGIAERTFGMTPRARIEFDFLSPVRFGDVVTTTLTVASVGRTSIVYDLLLDGTDGAFARGRIVTVLTDAPGGRPTEVPDDLRVVLLDE
jgi:acyl-CoA thioester hydrolase